MLFDTEKEWAERGVYLRCFYAYAQRPLCSTLVPRWCHAVALVRGPDCSWAEGHEPSHSICVEAPGLLPWTGTPSVLCAVRTPSSHTNPSFGASWRLAASSEHITSPRGDSKALIASFEAKIRCQIAGVLWRGGVVVTAALLIPRGVVVPHRPALQRASFRRTNRQENRSSDAALAGPLTHRRTVISKSGRRLMVGVWPVQPLPTHLPGFDSTSPHPTERLGP